MSYCFFQLEFNTPIHFGSSKGSIGLEKTQMNLKSDSLFSAILIESLKIYGKDYFDKLIKYAYDGDISLTDMLPYVEHKKDIDLYIPKPIVFFEKKEDDDKKENIKKKLKKIEFVSVKLFKEFIEFSLHKKDLPDSNNDFGNKNLVWKNFIQEGKECEPFAVSNFEFKNQKGNKNGLYFIVKLPDDDEFCSKFELLIESLGLSGIGGKKSSGYGKFEFVGDPEYIYKDELEYCSIKDLETLGKYLYSEGNLYMSLSTIKPKSNELDVVKTGHYTLAKRSGFVESSTYSNTPSKRKTVYMINSGSTFDKKLEGEVLDLNYNANHSVYRVGTGIFMGVDIDV